jgi:hypothetical protein
MWQEMVTIRTTKLPRFTVRKKRFHAGDFVEQARRRSANCASCANCDTDTGDTTVGRQCRRTLRVAPMPGLVRGTGERAEL